jgi:hypothetical protein
MNCRLLTSRILPQTMLVHNGERLKSALRRMKAETAENSGRGGIQLSV